MPARTRSRVLGITEEALMFAHEAAKDAHPEDWHAFDSFAARTTLDVLDVRLPDPESFFDFALATIDRELSQ